MYGMQDDFYRRGDRDDISMSIFDYNVFVATLLEDLAEICACESPGEFYRGEFRTYHSDSPQRMGSLCINLKTGRWTDIEQKKQGETPITYYAHIHKISKEEAIKALYNRLGFRYAIPGDGRVLVE